MTYSLSRFAIYETVRDKMKRKNKGPMPFHQKVLLGAFAGKWCKIAYILFKDVVSVYT